LHTSGEGSFAKVKIIVDYQNGRLHALKKFIKYRYISFIKIILLINNKKRLLFRKDDI
jgi:hypothetical protein